MFATTKHLAMYSVCLCYVTAEHILACGFSRQVSEIVRCLGSPAPNSCQWVLSFLNTTVCFQYDAILLIRKTSSTTFSAISIAGLLVSLVLVDYVSSLFQIPSTLHSEPAKNRASHCCTTSICVTLILVDSSLSVTRRPHLDIV